MPAIPAHLNTFAWDWSAWDDTYRFAQDKNETYILANLGDIPLLGIMKDINALLFGDMNIPCPAPISTSRQARSTGAKSGGSVVRLSSPTAVSSGRVWLWPVEFSLRGYEVTFQNPQIITGYANSIYYSLFGTLISVALPSGPMYRTSPPIAWNAGR